MCGDIIPEMSRLSHLFMKKYKNSYGVSFWDIEKKYDYDLCKDCGEYVLEVIKKGRKKG